MEIIKVNRDFEQIAKIEEIYNYSFPENERLAFSDILDKKAPDSSLYAFFDGEKLVGFSYISCFGDIAYIIYLAIDKNERNKNFGSVALSEIDKLYPNKAKVLCVEKPIGDDSCKTRRISFYERNGFKFSSFEFEYLGEEYLSLYKGKLDEDAFKKFLLVCFPGCKNFRNRV